MCIVLRPHHGMCFQFYEGKGYDADFTDHMGKIIRCLSDDPSRMILLKVCTDSVCVSCPNNQSGVCADQNKVTQYDKNVLSICGLHEGEPLRYMDFIASVKEKIIDAGLRKRICGDCCWNEICERKEVELTVNE